MRKLLFIAFICSSLCSYAQSETPEDTIKNRPPIKKEQVPFSPIEDKRTVFDEILPKHDMQGEQQQEIDLHITTPEYVEPLPWTDINKIHFQKNIFEWDFQRFADFLLSPEVVMTMYGNHTTYPAMGSIMQAGAGLTYYSPDGHWEISGGIYAAHYSMATPSAISKAKNAKRDAPRGTQWDIGYNASVAYRINPYMRLHAFGQYSGYGKSNSLHGYMNPMYPQSGYGMVLELKVTDWLDINGGLERSYDPTKMKWRTSPILAPTIRIKK